MTSFDEVLAEAASAPRPTQTVRVCLNQSVAAEKARLLDALDAARAADAAEAEADARLSAPAQPGADKHTKAALADLEAFDEEAKKAWATLKFTQLEGNAWALLTSSNPMRIDVPVDRHYGYDYDAVSEAAARMSGVRVDADGEHEIPDGQWDVLYRLLSGHDIEQIRDTVWTLNEFAPSQHIEALVKDFGAA